MLEAMLPFLQNLLSGASGRRDATEFSKASPMPLEKTPTSNSRGTDGPKKGKEAQRRNAGGDSAHVQVQEPEMVYDLLGLLGEGGFGAVHLASLRRRGAGEVGDGRTPDGVFAVKSLSKRELIKENSEDQLRSEWHVLANVRHPFIIAGRCAFQTENYVHLAMDFAGSTITLWDHMRQTGPMPAAAARFYAAEVLLAVQHLHDRRIVMRDLKPENIVLDACGHIRLVDFGLAFLLQHRRDGRARTLCGSLDYMAPEVTVRGGRGGDSGENGSGGGNGGSGGGYHQGADVWAWGCCLFELLTGRTPFDFRASAAEAAKAAEAAAKAAAKATAAAGTAALATAGGSGSQNDGSSLAAHSSFGLNPPTREKSPARGAAAAGAAAAGGAPSLGWAVALPPPSPPPPLPQPPSPEETEAAARERHYARLREGEIDYPWLMHRPAKDLLRKVLVRNPDLRMEWTAARAHPFFADVDWAALERREVPPPAAPPGEDVTGLGWMRAHPARLPRIYRSANELRTPLAAAGGPGGGGRGDGVVRQQMHVAGFDWVDEGALCVFRPGVRSVTSSPVTSRVS